MVTKKQLCKKQEYLDIVKWLDSEETGIDTCGTYEYCRECDKTKDYPCARAYYQAKAELSKEDYSLMQKEAKNLGLEIARKIDIPKRELDNYYES